MGGACSTYGEKADVYKRFWWESLKKRAHFEDPGVDGRVVLNWICRKWDGAWTGLIWLRIGTDGGLL